MIDILWFKHNFYDIMNRKYNFFKKFKFKKNCVAYGTLLLSFHRLISSVKLWFETSNYHENSTDYRSYDSPKGTIACFIQILGYRVIWIL